MLDLVYHKIIFYFRVYRTVFNVVYGYLLPAELKKIGNMYTHFNCVDMILSVWYALLQWRLVGHSMLSQATLNRRMNIYIYNQNFKTYSECQKSTNIQRIIFNPSFTTTQRHLAIGNWTVFQPTGSFIRLEQQDLLDTGSSPLIRPADSFCRVAPCDIQKSARRYPHQRYFAPLPWWNMCP